MAEAVGDAPCCGEFAYSITAGLADYSYVIVIHLAFDDDKRKRYI